jgi:uncharacterized protein YkwD
MRRVALLIPAFVAALAASFGSATPAHARGARMDRVERAMVHAVNVQRARAGLRAVHGRRGLARAADFHSREMLAGHYFAHESRNGGSFPSRVWRFTHSRMVGETLAMLSRCGRHSARQVASMWMHSPPHRAILLSGSFRHVGVARRSGRLGGASACMITADFSR